MKELFDDLEMTLGADGEDIGSKATVVTANNRLSRRLHRRCAEGARRRGDMVWETPDILPWAAWLQRCWDDLLMQGLTAEGPSPGLLLTPMQEQALWEEIISGSGQARQLLQVPQTARLVREARLLQYAWRVDISADEFEAGKDASAFCDWSMEFDRRCREQSWVDGARLPDLLAEFLAEASFMPPDALVCAGFDEFTPQQQALMSALETAGGRVIITQAGDIADRAARIAFPDAESEIVAAARWARSRLEARPEARIGIVVPELTALRNTLTRILDDVLHPGAVLPSAESTSPARTYNVSLGAPLADCPVVHSALLALEIARGELTAEQAGALLRAPFLASAEQEMSARALLDIRLRQRGEAVIPVRRLGDYAAGERGTARCPLLAGLLAQALDKIEPFSGQRLRPSAWAEHLLSLLQALGWPGQRPLNSDEHQAVEAWRELVASLAGLDSVTPAIDLDAALHKLRRLSVERLFQPERPETPIQVLGILETAGMRFDYLWVTGMHDEAWPPAPDPNPFLPIGLQRRLGLPRASPDRELEVARRITARLRGAAPDIVISHPLNEGDRALRPSPLILDLPSIPVDGIDGGSSRSYAELIHDSRRIEVLEDAFGPPLAQARAPGGSALFKDQAACAFRAFARFRLHARPLEAPVAGLDAAERGRLMHRVLDIVWGEIGSRDALDAVSGAALDALLVRAVETAIGEAASRRPQTFSVKFRGVEQQRLASRVREWLEVEKLRGPFDVEAREQKHQVSAGGVEVEVKIDRIDVLPGGRRAIIDYKTGLARVEQWFGDRPDEPQLPLYSLILGEELSAVLFSQIRPGEMAWRGVVRSDDIVSGVKAFEETRHAEAQGSWPELRRAWHDVLERLGSEFRAGAAAVDPKDYPKTCAYCGLMSLCRINESTSFAVDIAEREDHA